MRNKKLLAILTLVCFMFTLMPVAAFADDAVTVTTAADLKSNLENGKSVVLGGNITTTEAIVTSGVTATIDLGGNTLTIGAGDNKFNDASNITIQNGTINITGVTVKGNAVFCLDEYEETLVTTLTLNNVNLTGNGYSSAYGIFYIGDSSVLNVNGGEWDLTNDTHASGGVFKADDSKATLNISGTKMNLHNVRRVVTYAATTIEDATIAISGDADGVDAEMEHGFNRSPLTITDSTITMENMVGRGITAENGTVSIENSTVTMSNVQEATIDVRGGQTVTIDEDSIVTLDKEAIITSGSILGDVAIDLGEAAVAKIGKVEYASLQAAVDAAESGQTITLLDNATGAGVVFENGDNVIIDLNGKTYTLSESVGSSAQYGTVGFYLWAGSTVTVKNGTINMIEDVADDAYTFFKMFHSYGNLTLTDVTLDCTNGVAYNGSTDVGFIAVESDNGTVSIDGKTSITNCSSLSPETWTVVAYKDGKVTINTTGTIDGIVVSYGSSASVDIKNGNFTNSNSEYSQLYILSGGSLAVYDGTFSENPSAYVVADCVVMVNSDGTYGVVEKTSSEATDGIVLSDEAISLKVNNSYALTVDSVIKDAADKTVTWTSSDESVAIVDSNGKVTAKKVGTATITAAIANTDYSAECAVTVYTTSSGGGFTGSYNYPVNVDSAVNCDVELSDEYAIKGETVTITVTPDSGKKVKSVIVTDEDGDVIAVTKVAENKYTFVMPEGEVDVVVLTADADYTDKIVLNVGNNIYQINGVNKYTDVKPVIVGDRTLVPIRIVVEALGGDVDWDEATRTVTLTIDGKVLKLVIDKEIPGYGTGAIIVDGRTMVPIRYVSEYVGADVDWYADVQQVVIQK